MITNGSDKDGIGLLAYWPVILVLSMIIIIIATGSEFNKNVHVQFTVTGSCHFPLSLLWFENGEDNNAHYGLF